MAEEGPWTMVEDGTGPPAVLVHGIYQDHRVFDALVRAGLAGHRLFRPDLAGHGSSPRDSEALGRLETMADRLAEAVAARTPEPCHWVGFSAGALVVLALAARRPGAVRSLALISAAAYAPPRLKEVVESWRSAYTEGGIERLALRVAKDVHFTDYTDEHPEIWETMRERWAAHAGPGPARWADTVLRADLRPSVGRLRRPTLVMHGLQDGVIDPAQARFLRQSIPGSELKLYPRAGHMLVVERASEVASDLEDFWLRTERRPWGAAD